MQCKLIGISIISLQYMYYTSVQCSIIIRKCTHRTGKSTCKHHYSPYCGQLTEALRPVALRDGVSRIGEDWGAVTMAKHLRVVNVPSVYLCYWLCMLHSSSHHRRQLQLETYRLRVYFSLHTQQQEQT